MLFNSFGVGGSSGGVSGKEMTCTPDWDAGLLLVSYIYDLSMIG